MYSPVDEIKSRLDIVELIQGYIHLQKAGRNYRACCPFHSEKTPSMMISPEKQIWHCFGCGKGGSVFDFVMEMEGVEFGDALRILARRAGIELEPMSKEVAQSRTERSQLYDLCDLAARFFIKQLESQAGQSIQQYLNKRGLKQETIKEWRVGYAPGQWRALFNFLTGRGYSTELISKAGLLIKNESGQKYDRFRDRIIFPITDINGMTIGFTGRENPQTSDSRMGKYINIPNTLIYDKSRALYGFDKAKIDIRTNDACILVEGQVDVLMAHQAGFKNVIACSGTALTEQHLKTIKRYTDKIVMAFDMDSAGETATKRGIDLAVQFGFNVEIASLPEGQDPADCLLKNASAWSEAVKKSKKIMEFYFASALSKNDPRTVDGKKEITGILLPVIKKIPNKIEQTHWLQQVSREIGIQEDILIEEMEKIKDSVNYQPEEKPVLIEKKMPDREEYVLGLILSDFDNMGQIKQEPSQIFTNSNLGEIFEKLKQAKNLNDFKKTLSKNLADQVDYLVFKAEAYRDLSDKSDFKVKDEIEFCLNKMKDSYQRKQITNTL